MGTLYGKFLALDLQNHNKLFVGLYKPTALLSLKVGLRKQLCLYPGSAFQDRKLKRGVLFKKGGGTVFMLQF